MSGGKSFPACRRRFRRRGRPPPFRRRASCRRGDRRGHRHCFPSGNDAWSGSLNAPNSGGTDGPFLTLGRAQQAVQPAKAIQTIGSITVEVRSGTYALTQPLAFGPADSGTASLSITWEGFPGEAPVVSGGERISGWTNASGNIWSAPLHASTTSNLEGLFYNGQRRARPRTTEGTYLANAGPYLLRRRHGRPCPGLGRGVRERRRRTGVGHRPVDWSGAGPAGGLAASLTVPASYPAVVLTPGQY